MKDLVGQKFGKLTVEAFSHWHGYQQYWKCRCECGNEKIASKGNLRGGGVTSCGCRVKRRDLVGVRFGLLEVVSLSPIRDKHRARRWVCKCDCGKEITTWERSLVNGASSSCGCRQKMESDITGQRFGRLVVLGVDHTDKRHKRIWSCQCDCGNKTAVVASSLKSGLTKSCGCLARETITTHGMTHSSEYGTWQSMIGRCYNPSSKGYPYYGGRGIRVCRRWKRSFEAFYADMGPRPEGMTLDRKNPNGNYERDNCRWADTTTQAVNRRPSTRNMLGIEGVYPKEREGKWMARLAFKGKLVLNKTFSTLEEAVAARKAAEMVYFTGLRYGTDCN